AAARVRTRLDRPVAAAVQSSVADAAEHLHRLVGPGFVVRAGTRRLPDVHRYVRGIEYRLDRLSDDVARDRRRMAEVVPLEQRLASAVRAAGRRGQPAAAVSELGWQREELRMSLFAQPLGVYGQVSAQRLGQALDALIA
ncbi:MAG: DUF3418 domain-containing protein, partial [Actinomycetota bacterium]|nr:DUF3418 domain-containing protein [Actinomycetota bacterium]